MFVEIDGAVDFIQKQQIINQMVSFLYLLLIYIIQFFNDSEHEYNLPVEMYLN